MKQERQSVQRYMNAENDVKLRETNPEQVQQADGKGKTSIDTAVWDSQWQKRHPLREKGVRTYAIFAAIAVLCLAFVAWRLYTARWGGEEGQQAAFNAYVFELMEKYKPDFLLYDQLADPHTLLQEKGWQVTTLSVEQPNEPVRQLLGEGCVVQSWEELKLAEAHRLWRKWQSSDEEIRQDVFIIRELSLHIDYRTLPALRENTWLVTNRAGKQYLMVRWDWDWGIKPLEDFR